MSTTRPETILGDTAVAVHPEDERYEHLVGRIAVLPALNRQIPIIGDEAVQPEFGTGAVKITPAHDPDDYVVGLRHNLEAPTVLTEQGQMNELAGPYAGLDRYECRERIVADFQREGLLVKTEPYRHAVGTCQRCHTDIEPRISEQWFVKIKPLRSRRLPLCARRCVPPSSTAICPPQRSRMWRASRPAASATARCLAGWLASCAPGPR